MLVVAEILGHRQRRVADAKAGARRFVHLAEDHHHVRQYAGVLHVAVELLALATAFADPAEDAYALLMPDHVVDHLGEQHRLAHAGAAEQTRLAAALQRREHIDELDARFKDLGSRGSPRQRRRGPMHRTPLHVAQPGYAVDRVAEHVEHAGEDALAHRRLQGPARVLHGHAAGKPFGGRQRNPADAMRVNLRQHFNDDLPLRSGAQNRIDGRQMLIEPRVHDAAADRDHRAEGLAIHSISPRPAPFRNRRTTPTKPPSSTSHSPIAIRVAFTARSFSHQLVG